MSNVSAKAVHDALHALGVNPIGLFSVEIARIEGTLRVERLVTDSDGRYVIDDNCEYVTHTVTQDII